MAGAGWSLPAVRSGLFFGSRLDGFGKQIAGLWRAGFFVLLGFFHFAVAVAFTFWQGIVLSP